LFDACEPLNGGQNFNDFTQRQQFATDLYRISTPGSYVLKWQSSQGCHSQTLQ